MNELDFELSIRADGYDARQLESLSVVGPKEEEIISRLQSAAPLLLEGIRGSGKTTLLKLAAERSNRQVGEGGCLTAYVSFSRYLLLENPRIPASPDHPFRLWVSVKILHAVRESARTVSGTRPVMSNLSGLLDIRFDEIIAALENTFKLENGDATFVNHLPEATKHSLIAFQNPDRLKIHIDEIATAYGFRSINLLCDEAAQYFKPEFQPLFFGILKSIHSSSITFKAAIYPTVTYFGADFELGHDATLVSLTRPCLATEWELFCHSITDKRARDTNLWASKPVVFAALAFASFGIPRRFIELVGSVDIPTASELDILNSIKSHAHRELLQPFDALKARIPALIKDIELASYLLHMFIDDLKQENTVRTFRTAYIAVSKHRALPFALRKALNLMVYLGVLERQPPSKLGHTRETADRLLMNPALIIAENIMADGTKKRLSLSDTVERIRQLELDKYKEYGRNNKALQEAVSEAGEIQTKPCTYCGTEVPFGARFCTNCGAALSQTSILSHILSLSANELELTPGLKARVTERFATVGDILNASDEDLDALHYVGMTRVAIIRYAVDEMIAG